jgi:hypothetical protein
MADTQLEYHAPVSAAEDEPAPATRTAGQAGPAEPSRTAARPLSRAAIDMMTRLPSPMLRYTAAHFPHIVDRLASEWSSPARMACAIDDLIFDMRGGRTGFPMVVLNELGELRERYERWVGPPKSR